MPESENNVKTPNAPPTPCATNGWSESGRQATHPPDPWFELDLEGGTLTPALRKPFDVLARGLVTAGSEIGEGKVTRLELFAAGTLELEPEIRDLIREAA